MSTKNDRANKFPLGSGMEEYQDPGSGINIRVPQHCCQTNLQHQHGF
jgi:hypothetical protein